MALISANISIKCSVKAPQIVSSNGTTGFLARATEGCGKRSYSQKIPVVRSCAQIKIRMAINV